MKSRILPSGKTVNFIRDLIKTANDDKITVYAAQASFFVITSAIPFFSLLLSLTGLLLPQSDILAYLPGVAKEMIGSPSVPLLSISAVTTLWTASRGISAVRAGIENVYSASAMDGFFRRRVRSILSTVFFIVLIAVSAAVLLFGNLILRMLPAGFFSKVPWLVSLLRTPLFIVFMTVVFTAVYISVASRSASVSSRIFSHLPGAVLSSLGWVIFSMGYSLYIEHFPRASAVYGSLAAICLIMLWLYFCMVILLFGAVYNKLRIQSREHHKSSHNTNQRRS